jgi:hypothetical protein
VIELEDEEKLEALQKEVESTFGDQCDVEAIPRGASSEKGREALLVPVALMPVRGGVVRPENQLTLLHSRT